MSIDDRIKYLLAQFEKENVSELVQAQHTLIHELGKRVDQLTDRVDQLERRARVRKTGE